MCSLAAVKHSLPLVHRCQGFSCWAQRECDSGWSEQLATVVSECVCVFVWLWFELIVNASTQLSWTWHWPNVFVSSSSSSSSLVFSVCYTVLSVRDDQPPVVHLTLTLIRSWNSTCTLDSDVATHLKSPSVKVCVKTCVRTQVWTLRPTGTGVKDELRDSFCSLSTGVEWGLHFPAANGEYQSPINLNSREAQYDPSLLDISLSPNYVVCRDCEVINDGHTARIVLKSKSGDSQMTYRQTVDLRNWP